MRPVRPARPRPGRSTRAVLALAPTIASIGNTLKTASTVNGPGRTQLDRIDAQNGVGPNADNKVARSEFN